jgi:hypothetical protein
MKVAADPQYLGAVIGFMAILHSWSQSIIHHTHLHVIVPGGGISLDGKQWISANEDFLPTDALSKEFRRAFLRALKKAYKNGKLKLTGVLQPLQDPKNFDELMKKAEQAKWSVYSKKPMAGAQQILNYLAYYSHRTAMSNDRLVSIEDGKVAFKWKDYRDNTVKIMKLDVEEFMRRYLQHVLPNGFKRIRSYGFLANRNK